MSFNEMKLAPALLRALDELGYSEPTPIQRDAIPHGLEGRDVVGSAQTGTGKTAAFLLPILQRLDDGSHAGMRALVLVPTRELAEQVLVAARDYGKHTKVRAAAVYGGVGFDDQTRALRGRADLIVATPGRFLDHMERRNVDGRNVEVLVLDEADRMLDMGFAPAVNRILDVLPAARQTLLFSATISKEVDRLAQRALRDPVTVETARRAETAHGVEHVLIAVDQPQKREVLARRLGQSGNGRAIVFTRTKHGAERLATHLQRAGTNVTALHGGKTQGARNKALDRFRNGQVNVLVATDVAARGIDVDDVALVVNYDVPRDPEAYVHRVGRTARAGATGVALTLMSADEWLMMRDIEKLIGQSFPRQVEPGLEPAVLPMQPEERPRAPRPQGRSVLPRRGGLRRR